MATEQLFADRYKLDRRLGVGGMATVQLAFDTRLERNVAVKLLAEHLAEDSSFVSRFRREALAAARLVHPNIVQVFDFGSDAAARAASSSSWSTSTGTRAPSCCATAGRCPPRDAVEILTPGLPRAGLRAPQRRRAPRRQARQPDGQHRRRGQAGGLRHRQGGRAVGHHEGRLGAGHRGVPVARAGARRARRARLGHLRARRRLLPADGRAAALRGGLADRPGAAAGVRPAAAAAATRRATSRRRWPPPSPARWRATPSAATPTPPRWRTRCATAWPASRHTEDLDATRALPDDEATRMLSADAATGAVRPRRPLQPVDEPPRRAARAVPRRRAASRAAAREGGGAGKWVALRARARADRRRRRRLPGDQRRDRQAVELNEDVGGNVDEAVQSFKDLSRQNTR